MSPYIFLYLFLVLVVKGSELGISFRNCVINNKREACLKGVVYESDKFVFEKKQEESNTQVIPRTFLFDNIPQRQYASLWGVSFPIIIIGLLDLLRNLQKKFLPSNIETTLSTELPK